MIDPWTALGAAGAIVGFIDLGITVVERTNEMKRSQTGAVNEVEALEGMTARLRQEANRLANAPTTHSFLMSDDEKRLQEIALECKALSDRFTASFGALQIGKAASTRQALFAAWKSERKKPSLAAYREELKEKRTEVMSVMLATISE
jgi:hypothetical protein